MFASCSSSMRLMCAHEIRRRPTFIGAGGHKSTNPFLNPRLKTMRGFRQGFVLGGHSNSHCVVQYYGVTPWSANPNGDNRWIAIRSTEKNWTSCCSSVHLVWLSPTCIFNLSGFFTVSFLHLKNQYPESLEHSKLASTVIRTGTTASCWYQFILGTCSTCVELPFVCHDFVAVRIGWSWGHPMAELQSRCHEPNDLRTYSRLPIWAQSAWKHLSRTDMCRSCMSTRHTWTP